MASRLTTGRPSSRQTAISPIPTLSAGVAARPLPSHKQTRNCNELSKIRRASSTPRQRSLESSATDSRRRPLSDKTSNLSLPFILPSQAQKHVTHNAALQMLDAIVQLAIVTNAATPPDNSAEGACYLVDRSQKKAGTEKGGLVPCRQAGAWPSRRPGKGWRACSPPMHAAV